MRLDIQCDRGAYRLAVDGMDCDYLKFCEALESREAVGCGHVGRFEAAAELYAGEYLSGWECSWAAAKRVMLERRYIDLLLGIALCHKSAGDYPAAARALEKGLAQEPLHRSLNYRLVEALLLGHDRAMATKYYDLYRDGLMKKFQTEPDADFKGLFT